MSTMLRFVRRRGLAVAVAAGALGCLVSATPGSAAAPERVSAALSDADGRAMGEVYFTPRGDAIAVDVTATGLEPGYHGFHVHEIGRCEPDSRDPNDTSKTGDFLSAGGHLTRDDADHPDHDGDMPALLADQNGRARMSFMTDRLRLEEMTDGDGSAVMIHAGPDNFANIPGRYAHSGPDADTKASGDAGDRIACGVVDGG